MLKLIVLWFLIFLLNYDEVILRSIDDLEEDPLSNEIIDHINTIQNSWTASRYFGKNTSLIYLKNLMGVKQINSIQPKLVKRSALNTVTQQFKYPKTFDARKRWPNCPTIGEIRDQGSCGSCWAVAAVEVMSDRFCIHSNGTEHFYFSAQHLMSCCSYCSNDANGCNGGDPTYAWYYWEHEGIVSGGPYNSNLGCAPYKIPPCDHYVINSTRPNCKTMSLDNYKCVDKCKKGYKLPLIKDLHFGKSITKIENDVEKIKQEIFTNGPVQAEFHVYEDFLHYKSGVYTKVHGDILGRHAIRILGWGVENDKPYWLAANSWNSDWGNNGFFKILRGSNECGIENKIIAGLPA